MVTHYIIQGIFVLVVANAGRNRARLFYAAIGLLMIATGVFFFLSIQGCI